MEGGTEKSMVLHQHDAGQFPATGGRASGYKGSDRLSDAALLVKYLSDECRHKMSLGHSLRDHHHVLRLHHADRRMPKVAYVGTFRKKAKRLSATRTLQRHE